MLFCVTNLSIVGPHVYCDRRDMRSCVSWSLQALCMGYQSLNLICDGGVSEQEDAPAELTLEGTSALGLAMHVDLFRKITSVQKG